MQLLQGLFFYESYLYYVYDTHEFGHDDDGGVLGLNDYVVYFALPSLFMFFCLINNFWQ
jgi:hypothetical protein